MSERMFAKEETLELPARGCTRNHIYDLIESLRPTTAFFGAEADATLELTDDGVRAKMLIPRWKKFSFTYEDFADASLTNSLTLFTLEAGGIIHAVKLKHSEAFAGCTTYTLSVGISGTLDKHLTAFDVAQAVGDDVMGTNGTPEFESHAAGGTGVLITAVATVDNLDQATAGAVDVWVLYSAAI